ncbi:MAG: flagellar biosynthetic protein FliR [Myxococcota bacterium]|nr:flagellar biosynthetic protein FliR [Myxococcota bacterium]
MLESLVFALRGAAAVGVLTTLAGGVPRIVQVGLAVIVGLWSALLAPQMPIDSVLLVAARELVIGVTIGLVAVMPILAAVTAGRIVDIAGNGREAYRGLFAILAGAVFVGIDGHVTFVTTIVESFRAVPAMSAVPVLDAIGSLVGSAVRLAVPWLVTAAVVEIAVGVGMRLAGRAGNAAPAAAAVPAALVMMTAALVGTLAVAFAALVR